MRSGRHTWAIGIGGGQPPYEISVVRGQLPRGLSFVQTGKTAGPGPTSSAVGAPGELLPVVQGTPTELTDADFDVQVRDATGSSTVKNLSVKVAGSCGPRPDPEVSLRTRDTISAGSSSASSSTSSSPSRTPAAAC